LFYYLCYEADEPQERLLLVVACGTYSGRQRLFAVDKREEMEQKWSGLLEKQAAFFVAI